MKSISINGIKAEVDQLAIAALAIVYLVGITGILGNIHPQFIYLTPINLLFSTVLVLLNHGPWKAAHVGFLVLCFVIGFFSEVLGVQTGLIFGEYSYGDVLGLKLWGTPLMIGVNWLMLVYCSCVTVNHITVDSPAWLKATLAAGAMVLLDILIEPVAIDYRFWTWEEAKVPLQNYLAWFLIALVLCFLFQKMIGARKNKVAVVLFILQFLFFLILGVVS